MILVNLSQSWPLVLEGKANAADVTLGRWAQLRDSDLEAHADAILGIYKNEVVTAFDIEDWRREGDRVTFIGHPSQIWAHLIRTSNPGKHWKQGMARPVQILPTAVLTGGNMPIEETPEGRRAVIDGYVLVVKDGSGTVYVPEGGKVTVGFIAVPSETA
jgi:hypothetical protein